MANFHIKYITLLNSRKKIRVTSILPVIILLAGLSVGVVANQQMQTISQHAANTAQITPATASVQVKLQYIDIGPNSGNGFKNNNKPVHTDKPITIAFYNTTDDSLTTPVASVTGTVSFNQQTGTFDNTNLTLDGVAAGDYKVYLQVDGYLRKYIGIRTIQSGNNAITQQPVELIAGDVTKDNTIDIADYNAVISCFSTADNPTANCSSLADINDSGNKTDNHWLIDLDLLLTNFGRQYGD